MCVYVFLYASVYMPVWLSARECVYNYVRVFCECVLVFVCVNLCGVLCVRACVCERDYIVWTYFNRKLL